MNKGEQKVPGMVSMQTLPTEELRQMIHQLNEELQRRNNHNPSQYIEDYFDPRHIPRLKMLCFDAHIEQLSTLAAYKAYRPTLLDLSRVDQNTFFNKGALEQNLWTEIKSVLKAFLQDRTDDKVVKLNPYY